MMDKKHEGLKEFGQILSELRKKLDLTQLALAEILNTEIEKQLKEQNGEYKEPSISFDLISKWERAAYDKKRRRHWRPPYEAVIGLIKIFAKELTLSEAEGWASLVGYELSGMVLEELLNEQSDYSQAYYIDRKQIQANIEEILLSKRTDILVLYGIGGAGKTTLANWAAETLAKRFRDGVILIDNQPGFQISMLQAEIASRLGITKLAGRTDTERKGELSRYLLAKQLLLIIDDLGDDKSLAGKLGDLKIGNKASPILITTRDRKIITSLPVTFLEIKGMTEEEGFRLLKKWGWANESLEIITELMRQVECSPLALKLIGAQLRTGKTPVELLTYFQTANLKKFDTITPNDRSESLTLCFDLSYERLADTNPKDQIYFAQLGRFFSTFDIEATKNVLNVNFDEIEDSLNQLHRLGLVEKREKLYFLHPLLRAYALKKLSEIPELEKITYERHAHYFLQKSAPYPHEFLGLLYEYILGNPTSYFLAEIFRYQELVRTDYPEFARWSIADLAGAYQWLINNDLSAPRIIFEYHFKALKESGQVSQQEYEDALVLCSSTVHTLPIDREKNNPDFTNEMNSLINRLSPLVGLDKHSNSE